MHYFLESIIFLVHKKRGGAPETKKTADHHQRSTLQRSRSEKDLHPFNVSAHVNKYYNKHHRRKDHDAAKAAAEEAAAAAAANEEAASHVERSRAVLQTANRLAIMLRYVERKDEGAARQRS
jgi:hypothetical protein